MLSKIQNFLAKIFDQRGGTWVGATSATALFMAVSEFITSGFGRPGMPGWHPIAPAWFVAVPAGLFCFILGMFVGTKGVNYYMDSRFNSPAGEKPQPQPPPPHGP